MNRRRSNSAPTEQLDDRSPRLACNLPLEGDAEKLHIFKQFVEDLATRTEQSFAIQLSQMEKRLRSTIFRYH